jgi:ABC-type transport system involved in multi-copper enzyme maturation permease subunit
MIKKEFREIFVSTLLRLSVLLIFPLFSLLEVSRDIGKNNYYQFLSLTVGLVIIWIAATCGIDAFKAEHRDQAMEYLFSFPFSKSKIALYKLIPRVSILLFLIACNLVVDFIGFPGQFEGEGVLFYIIMVFSPLCLVMFFLFTGFFVSMFFEKKKSRIFLNAGAIFSMAAVSLGIHSLLMSSDLVKHNWDISFAAGCLIVLAAVGTAFGSVYRKMDLKPAKIHGKKFAYRALLPLAVLAAAGAFLFFSYGV